MMRNARLAFPPPARGRLLMAPQGRVQGRVQGRSREWGRLTGPSLAQTAMSLCASFKISVERATAPCASPRLASLGGSPWGTLAAKAAGRDEPRSSRTSRGRTVPQGAQPCSTVCLLLGGGGATRWTPQQHRAPSPSATSFLTRISHLKQGPERGPVHLTARRSNDSEGNAQHQLNKPLSWSPNAPLFLVEIGIFLHLY